MKIRPVARRDRRRAWRGIFADDFVSDTSEAGGNGIEGADAFVEFTRKSLRSQPTVHQVHAPEIELTSPPTGSGVWAHEDVIRFAPVDPWILISTKYGTEVLASTDG